MGTVLVDMKFCDKKHKITVTEKEDGNLNVHIATNCNHIKDYYKNLGDTLTVEDVTDRKGSKVFDPDVCFPCTITCLVPSGVVSAAWLELGMLSESRAKKIGSNCIVFTGSKDE
ncbi:MAG: hypothetical protein GX137_06305 [Thermoplasmatales archaeon]|jgi:hypothetical protein|nr:hypothetical protein [Thermoplasmatales archaeon]